MDNFQNQEKIEKYLDELSSEYRSLLFNALVEQSGSIEDLNVSDLLRLDNDVKKHLRFEYKKYEKKRRVLFAGGLGYMLCAVFMFLCFEITKFEYGSDYVLSLLSLIIGFMGLIICVFSFALPTSVMARKGKQSNASEERMALAKYDVIATWRDLEGLVSDLALDKDINTPRSAIAYLSDSNLIDQQEHIALRTLLKLRNEITHSSEFSYTYDEVRKTINDANAVLTKLMKVLG